MFASGFIPIIHARLPQRSALAFGFYFAGLVLGQLSIYTFVQLRRPRRIYPIVEAVFGLTLLAMGALLDRFPVTLIPGRFAEGLAGGLGLPLMFSYVRNLKALKTVGQQITLFNSGFAVGFVVGPLSVSWMIGQVSPGRILFGFGLLFIALGAALSPLLAHLPGPAAGEVGREGALSGVKWFDSFFTLFLAKSFYGFLLPFFTATLLPRLAPLTLTTAMLAFSAVFVLGQGLANPLTRAFPLRGLEVALPLVLGAVVLGVRLADLPFAMYLAALLHSFLLFIAFLQLANKPGTAREFALFNSLSDPGMVLGAMLAGIGVNGMFGLFALCLFPLVRTLTARPE